MVILSIQRRPLDSKTAKKQIICVLRNIWQALYQWQKAQIEHYVRRKKTVMKNCTSMDVEYSFSFESSRIIFHLC